MTDINFNQTYAQCIKEVSDWGSTRIHNICDGSVQNIPWGAMDYVGMAFLVILAAAVIVACNWLIREARP